MGSTFAFVKNLVFVIVFFILARPAMPVLEYIINYDYIAKELCENKAKPQLHCNGKCHLMKQLAKAAEQEKPAPGKKTAHAESEVLFCHAVKGYVFLVPVFVPEKKQPWYHNHYSHLSLVSVFHPPAVIA